MRGLRVLKFRFRVRVFGVYAGVSRGSKGGSLHHGCLWLSDSDMEVIISRTPHVP